MRQEKLSQFVIDPQTEKEFNVVVPSNWLKQLMADYQKATNEITHLNSVIAYQSKVLGQKEDRINFLEDTSTLVLLDVKA